jgi:hypothetical protein
MRQRTALALLATLSVAACATTAVDGRGWSGDGAEPFDGARTACEAEAASKPAGPERTASFEACMAGKGWHRR